jgi:hypothetical protein
MPILANRPSRSLMMLTTASAMLVPYGLLRAAEPAPPDACRWLTAGEATPFVGNPSTPAFRATDQGHPSATGNSCVYRGSGGRQIIVTSTGDGGRQTDDILGSVRGTMAGGLQKAGNPDLAATTDRVLVRGPAGPWDAVNWIPGGTLFVTKGDQGFNIDMGGASGSEEEALAIARLIVPRLAHPLTYDGARAAAAAPQSAAHRARACAVVPASAVVAAIGPLDGAPQEDQDGTKCVYRVNSKQGPRSYPIEFVWEGGLKNYNMLAHGMDTLGSTMGGAIPTGAMNSMPTDANTSAMIGGLMKMVGGGGNAAPGAVAQVGFKTENNLPGPWDNATLQHGTQLMAVKGDVMVAMDLTSAEYDKAKALLAAAASRM